MTPQGGAVAEPPRKPRADHPAEPIPLLASEGCAEAQACCNIPAASQAFIVSFIRQLFTICYHLWIANIKMYCALNERQLQNRSSVTSSNLRALCRRFRQYLIQHRAISALLCRRSCWSCSVSSVEWTQIHKNHKKTQAFRQEPHILHVKNTLFVFHFSLFLGRNMFFMLVYIIIL